MRNQETQLKVMQFSCSFKGVAVDEASDHGEYDNSTEFDHIEDKVAAFTLDGSVLEWLRISFNIAISPNIRCLSPSKDINYGNGSFESFLTSKHISFYQISKTDKEIGIQIQFDGRKDFVYEISIKKIISATESEI